MRITREQLVSAGLAGSTSVEIFDHIQELSKHLLVDIKLWQAISAQVLNPDHPFEVHRLVHQAVFHAWPTATCGPPPLWVPESVATTNLHKFMCCFQGDLWWNAHRCGDPQRDVHTLHTVSCQNPETFWTAVLIELGIPFHTPPSRILQEHPNPDECRWLPGARLNIAASALSSPRSLGDSQPALLWAGEGAAEQLQSISLAELRSRASHVAACLRQLLEPGDPVALYMAMSPEAVVAYLGAVLAGCPVVSIADSFAAGEVAVRLRIAGAKAIITQDVLVRDGKQLPLYSRVLEAAGPPAVVVPAVAASGLQVELRPGDWSWPDFLEAAPPPSGLFAHVANAGETTNILFSSGTTGEPKAIPWSHVTPLRCAVDAWAHQDVHPGDVLAWPSSLGWMMGPWLLYAALLNGATIAIFQGSPLGREFGQFVAAAHVTMLGVVPSIVKAWRHTGCMQGLDWSHVRCFSSTGEASSPDDCHWLMARAGYKPIIEYCGGTELAGAYMSGTMLQPQAASLFTMPAFGTAVQLLDPKGLPQGADQPCTGEVALVAPTLGCSQRLLNRDHYATYYQGMPLDPVTGRPLRRHGDELERLPGGFFRALGRCDDTMNLGGIKVSSVEIERAVLEGVPAVSEAAAVGVPSSGGGPELLHLFLLLRPNSGHAADARSLRQLCQQAIRKHLNPLFKVEAVEVRAALPRTATNKVMRRELRAEAMQRPHSKL